METPAVKSSSGGGGSSFSFQKKTTQWESLYTGIESAINTTAEAVESTLFEAEPAKPQGKKIISLAKNTSSLLWGAN